VIEVPKKEKKHLKQLLIPETLSEMEECETEPEQEERKLVLDLNNFESQSSTENKTVFNNKE
jgi:hypothetical protein